MRHYSNFHAAVLACSLAWSSSSQAQDTSGVSVSVRQQPSSSGRVVYHYQVVNQDREARRITAVVIGYDDRHGEADLSEVPVGWTFKNGLHAGSVGSPARWKPLLVTTEGSPHVQIDWRNDGTADLPPGTVQSGYSVVLARPDRSYVDGHWMVIFDDASAASGQLALDGRPRIAVDTLAWHASASDHWNFSLQLSNTGTDDAVDVQVSQLACAPASASLATPALPAMLGQLKAGGSVMLPAELHVSAGAAQCTVSVSGSYLTKNRRRAAFSSSAELRPKLP